MKRKKDYVIKDGLLHNAKDYSYYKLSFSERILYFVLAAAVGAVIGWLFYESKIVSVIVAVICGFAFLPIRRNQIINKRQQALQLQFRDMLESISTSLDAGSNVQDAFTNARDDMELRYGPDSDIFEELCIINEGVSSNINIEDLLLDFGDRSQLKDVLSFANVFETCYRKGGNIKQVIKNTYSIISDKIDIALEIRTVIASKKSEQNVMMCMPIIFVFLIKMMGTDMVDLSSAIGRISTTVAVVLFVASYFIGKKILDIKL